MNNTSHRCQLLLVALVIGCLGCSGSDMTTVPVAGKVTFDGGPPPYPGRLSFVAIESTPELPARDGTASFTTTGEFEAITSTTEGLMPGKYRIEVTCNKHALDETKKDPVADATVVSPSYKPMEITVEKGSPQRNLTIDVPLKK